MARLPETWPEWLTGYGWAGRAIDGVTLWFNPRIVGGRIGVPPGRAIALQQEWLSEPGGRGAEVRHALCPTCRAVHEFERMRARASFDSVADAEELPRPTPRGWVGHPCGTEIDDRALRDGREFAVR